MSTPRLLPVLLALAAGCGGQTATVPDGLARCGDVALPQTVESNGTPLVLNGMAVRDVTIFAVDVYVGALYLETPSRDADQVVESEQRKRIVLEFVREVTRTDIVNAWESGFIANAGTERLGLTQEIAQFEAAFEDVEEGARMQFDFVPGEGLTYRHDGEVRATIANPAFARAFLLVFLGPNPPSAELKAGLLGAPCGN